MFSNRISCNPGWLGTLFVAKCGVLNENVPYSPICLDTWSVVGCMLVGLGCVALKCVTRVSFEDSKPCIIPSLPPLLSACGSRHKIPVPAPTSVFCPVITDSCPSGTMLTEKMVQRFLHLSFLLRTFQIYLEFDLLDGESHGKQPDCLIGT